MRRHPLIAALVILSILLLIAPSALAADTPPNPPTIFGLFSAWPQWVQGLVEILGAVSALGTALSFFLGLLGSFWPPALKAAAWCSKAGVELHQLGAWVGSLAGGQTAPPNAAMAPVKKSTPPPANAGFVRLDALVGLGGAMVVVVIAACTPAQSAADQKLAQCILAANLSAPTGLSDIQQIEYDAAQCTTDIVTVVNDLDADLKAKQSASAKDAGGDR